MNGWNFGDEELRESKGMGRSTTLKSDHPLSLALLDHSIYPQHFLRLQRGQRVKEFVRRSFFHQPPDGLGLGEFRYAAVNQWVKVRTQTPGTDHGNGVVIGELQSKFVLSSARKKECSKRGFFFYPFNVLKTPPSLETPGALCFQPGRSATRSGHDRIT